ncbi:UDP-glucuronosyltransferase 3A2-like isoform X2 [Lynx rufus]|uniref:UDP-glucuronosyltransferase 3A2-like isoform X2 n=1 Tax=Lynx rufus TaxID=61384 RepID=UPI001F126142|nr:UDP-glucuronosyltransferase 3A2-like isoform X2 [Lynx rufus]XP_046929891.1 UDP-glucuronosyltransferase 3A2-like isoform X2 [Lynx rufus]
MAGQRVLLLAGFLLPGFLLSEAAKILTLSLVGGSHHLLLDRVSQILQDHGHNVTMLHQRGNSFISDFKEKEISYQVIPWLPPEDYNKGLKNNFDFFIEEALGGRYTFGKFLKLMEQVGLQCSHFLRRSDIMDSLKNENFDLVIVENFDYCPFLVAEKLGKPFVSILSSSFGAMDFGLPNPLSYVPVLHSLLTDHMDFWGRVKNFLMFFDFTMRQRQIQSAYDNTIKEHFPEGSRPVLSHLLKKAELWFVNSDFALEFARPLLPNTVYVGGLMARPVTPVPQEFENFIAKFGDSGFVLVALGSMVSTFQSQELLREMNSAFAHLSQGVIWKYKPSHWPKDVKLAANVKIVDWLPQNDLLAHPRIRLFVTHGGMNSIMEAIQHGVPMVGIPLFGDQPENLVRVEAKKFGVSIPLKQIKEETLAVKMKQVIEDKRYKSAAVAASIIRRSHPLTPAQRLVGWIDHILQTGGAAHLKPHALQQPWHEQYLLDVFLFLLVVTLGTLWLCGKLLGMVARWLCGARKLKKA